jgi:hypothetical protein
LPIIEKTGSGGVNPTALLLATRQTSALISHAASDE